MTLAAAGVLLAAIGAQTFWIARALDQISTRLDRIDDHPRPPRCEYLFPPTLLPRQRVRAPTS